MKLATVIDKIQTTTPKKGVSTKIIAIDGPGGAGKTVLAEKIGEVLNAQVIHTDDFFDPIIRDNWWKRFVVEVLKPLSSNTEARYQRYDWDEKSLAEWHTIKPSEFVIIEGVQASRKDIRDFAVFHIWVETPRDTRLQRGLERDGEDAVEEWAKWMAQEDAYIRDEHPDMVASLIIDGTDSELLAS